MSRLMLCGLMSGVILCSSAPVRADDAEDKAVAFVEKLGGTVERDEKAPGKPVVTVNFASTQVTDEGMKDLKELRNLSSLVLRRTQVTDSGLKELKELKCLSMLDLCGTPVTDAALKQLMELKNLSSLSLAATWVTDTGLKELKGFNKVFLKPGEQKSVTIPIDRGSFAFYDPERRAWAAEKGEFKILIGSSSRDIRLQESARLTQTTFDK
jgi:hypothetical protein